MQYPSPCHAGCHDNPKDVGGLIVSLVVANREKILNPSDVEVIFVQFILVCHVSIPLSSN